MSQYFPPYTYGKDIKVKLDLNLSPMRTLRAMH